MSTVQRLYIIIGILFDLVSVSTALQTNCGFVFDATPLNTCNTNYDEQISYEYYCEESKIYKCLYTDTDCNGTCVQHEYTGYDIADCNINSTCSIAQYNIYENCEHKRESKSVVVDECITNSKYNKSIIWKCKQSSLAKYVYNGASCDEIYSSVIFENNKCQNIDAEYISMEIISCSSPKCRITQDSNSYQICNIFDDTNVDEVIPFWDTYSDDYCDWFGEDPSFAFNIYQCDRDGDELGLTLSLAANTIYGTLDTRHYLWPHDLHRLNLNDLALNGDWNWWSLGATHKLQYIDISNNNFSATLDLFPFLYSLNTLQTVKISNNPQMSGFIDWQWISFMANEHELNAFIASKISFSGYADFTSIPCDKRISIELDKEYHCDPYKYICKQSARADRSQKRCNDRLSCEATCKCADGSSAIATHFPYAPVVGSISCGDLIESKYDSLPQTKGIWGDSGHYYWIDIPTKYEQRSINITFDARYWTNFDGRVTVYTLQDLYSNAYKKVYDIQNPLHVTVSLKADNFHYLHIISNHSMNGMHCANNNSDEDKYSDLFEKGFYRAGYKCDYSAYQYSISMEGCTKAPTPKPTLSPTVFYSTISDDNQWTNADVIFDVTDKYEDCMIIYDVYSRIELSIKLWIQQDLQMDTDCLQCFEWLLREEHDANDTQYISLNEYYGYSNSEVTFYNAKSGLVIMDGIVYDVFRSYLIIKSIRTQNAGFCADREEITDRIFHAANTYSLKLIVSAENIDISVESEAITLKTHSPPFGGQCVIYRDESDDDIDTWRGYILNCSDWSSYMPKNNNLSYNMLYESVPLYTNQFVPNPLSAIIGGSGDTVITALIKDAASVISCYDVVVKLGTINNSNIGSVTHKISNIIYVSEVQSSTMEIVSMFNTIRAILSCDCIKPSSYKIYYDLTDTLLDILLSSSLVLNMNHSVSRSVSLQSIVYELSIFVTATHVDTYIGVDALELLIHDYIAKLLKSMKHYSGSADMYAIAVELHHLVLNIEAHISTFDDLYTDDFITAATQNTLHASHLALFGSYAGEIFNYSIGSKHVIAQKFKSDTTTTSIQCGFESQYIEIPREISTAHMIFDCSFLKVKSDWNSSDIISVNLYEDDSHLPINAYRRSNYCDPYLISFYLNDYDLTQFKQNYSLYESTSFPACKVWNNSFNGWYDKDCFVYDVNELNNKITCGCTRLGTHRVLSQSSHMVPNVVPSWNWRDLSNDTLSQHWIGWLSVAVLFVIILSLCGLKWMNNTVNRPILAYEDVIFLKSRNERMKNDISGKEIAYIERYLGCDDAEEIFDDDDMCCRFRVQSLCTLHAKLFVVYLLDGHIFLSIFVHPSGSNISIRTRIGLFFMYLCTLMAISALFYGLAVHIMLYVDVYHDINGIILSIVNSILSALPVYCVQQLFVKSKPKMVRKSVYLYEDIELQRVSSMNEELNDDNILDYLRESHHDKAEKYQHVNNIVNLNQIYAQSLTRIKRNSIDERIATVDTAVEELRKTNSNVHRLQLVDDIRLTLFNTLYPFPHFCKWIAWLLLICWTAFVALITIIFSVQFDLKYEAVPNPDSNHLMLYETDCWQNDLQLLRESQLAYQNIRKLNGDLSPSMAMRWSTSCCISVLVFTLLLQPITIYITTWLKIWMFSHHLTMKMSLRNIYLLFEKACCGSRIQNNYRIARHDTDLTEFESHVSYTYRRTSSIYANNKVRTRPRRSSSSAYNIVHPDRRLDVFGYLCNDDLFLSIDSKSGKLCAMNPTQENNRNREEIEINARFEAPSIDIAQCTYDDEDYYKEYHYEEEHDDDDVTQTYDDDASASHATVIRHSGSGSHQRQTSFTDLSVTMTENGEFDSRELAMMRVAAGNIFDYKADVIDEGDEAEEEECSNVFSFDINSDGIDESDDDDIALSHISMNDDFDAFDELDDDLNNPMMSKNNPSDETLTRSETSDEDLALEGNSDDTELIDTIARALSDENNKDRHVRTSTESMLHKATNILTANLYPSAAADDNDYDLERERNCSQSSHSTVDIPIYDEDGDDFVTNENESFVE